MTDEVHGNQRGDDGTSTRAPPASECPSKDLGKSASLGVPHLGLQGAMPVHGRLDPLGRPDSQRLVNLRVSTPLDLPTDRPYPIVLVPQWLQEYTQPSPALPMPLACHVVVSWCLSLVVPPDILSC